MNIRRLLPIGVLLVFITSLAACAKVADGSMPDDLKQAIDEQLNVTEEFALTLDGAFGDWHMEMMDSDLQRKYLGYDEKLSMLRGFQEKIGAYYVYTFYTKDKNDLEYTIAMDASDKPDAFGAPYPTEPCFVSAWEGQPSATALGWNIKQNDPVWSTYAPIRNSQGEVVAILGVDKPQPILKKYPEFNEPTE
jgi:hypothetical protein